MPGAVLGNGYSEGKGVLEGKELVGALKNIRDALKTFGRGTIQLSGDDLNFPKGQGTMPVACDSIGRMRVKFIRNQPNAGV